MLVAALADSITIRTRTGKIADLAYRGAQREDESPDNVDIQGGGDRSESIRENEGDIEGDRANGVWMNDGARGSDGIGEPGSEGERGNGGATGHGRLDGSDERLKVLAVDHFQFVWRSLRRLGVAQAAVDDGAQRVFEIAARKIDNILVGCERAFLFQTALRVASAIRRHTATRCEVMDGELVDQQRDPGAGPEEVASLRECRALLDDVLDAMPLPLRTVFVLFELDELSTAEIAGLLDIPVGTVASRLRRAREVFCAQAKRVRAQTAVPRGMP